MIAEQCFSHTLNMNRGSFHTRRFRRINFFAIRCTKNGFTGPKGFRDFRETGLWPELVPVSVA